MNAVAAIFDVDGTLVRANAVDYYLFLVRRLFPRAEGLKRTAWAAVKAPYWFLLDRIDRVLFNESFYRCYEGLSSGRAAELAEACFEGVFKRRLNHPAAARLEDHRNRGDRVLLVSGTLDFLLRPLAHSLGVEACLCPSLQEEEGSFTGRLDSRPVVGLEKAERIRRYAAEHGLDLGASFAYADSASDLPVLEMVGHPVVVNAGFFLKREASRRGWEIL